MKNDGLLGAGLRGPALVPLPARAPELMIGVEVQRPSIFHNYARVPAIAAVRYAACSPA